MTDIDIEDEVKESFLSATCKAVREILSSHTYMVNKCKDTKKPDSEAFIGNSPLNWKQLIREYNCSVYHTCREKSKSFNGVSEIQGIIYIDFSRKITEKSGKVVTDELDKFAWTALQILLNQYPTLNDTVDEFEFVDKMIWKPTPSGSDEMPDEKLLHYICQVTLVCKYIYDYQATF